MANIDWGNARASMNPQGFQPNSQYGQASDVAQAAQDGAYPGYAPAPQHVAPQAGAYAPHVQQIQQTQATRIQAAQAPGAQGYPAPSSHAMPHMAGQMTDTRYDAYGQAGYDQASYDQAGYGAAENGGGNPPPAAGAPRFAALMNYAGAAISLALVAGLGLWGYQLAVRDVTGIPVVRALEGPMRVQPDDPGGLAAAHQGLAVNSVQASGGASAASDRVALAPAPETLDDEDLPANPAAAAAMVVPEAPKVAPIEVSATLPGAGLDLDQLEADPVAAALAIADEISRNAQPLSEAGKTEDVTRAAAISPTALPQKSTQHATGPKIIPASVPGVSRSLRPSLRPANLLTVKAVVPAASAPAPTDVELSADAIPAGTRLVQLGAFESAEIARAEWNRLNARFDEYLPGKTRVIQKAQSGGKAFYRLRAMGFKDLADARRFCSALMAGKAACIPVVTR